MKSILLTLVVVLVVVAGIWYFRGDNAENEDQDTQQQDNSSTPSNNNSSTPTPTPNKPTPTVIEIDDGDTSMEEIPNGFKGELQSSNDSSRGNLMLLLEDSDRIIYLNTSRDYSSLVGEDVLVTIDGSLDDFRLVDIVPQGN